MRGENEKLLEGPQGSDEAAEVAAARDAALEPVQDRGLMSDVDGCNNAFLAVGKQTGCVAVDENSVACTAVVGDILTVGVFPSLACDDLKRIGVQRRDSVAV